MFLVKLELCCPQLRVGNAEQHSNVYTVLTQKLPLRRLICICVMRCPCSLDILLDVLRRFGMFIFQRGEFFWAFANNPDGMRTRPVQFVTGAQDSLPSPRLQFHISYEYDTES